MVEDAPLHGPFAFRPGFALVAGSLPVPVEFVVPNPVEFVEPMPVVPGVVVLLGDDIPDVLPVAEPPIEPPVEAPPLAPPAAPPPAPPAPPPPPPPAANAKLLDKASVAASRIVLVLLMIFSFGIEP